MGDDDLGTLFPARLSAILEQGLRGHHPLFHGDEIRAAFESPDAAMAGEDADDVGRALLAICRGPAIARSAVAGLSRSARVSLIRLYFRLLDRAEEERRLLQ